MLSGSSNSPAPTRRAPWSENTISSPSNDRRLTAGLGLLSLVVGGLVVLILVFLVRESALALDSLGPSRLLGDSGWYPLEDRFDLKPMLLGSALVAGGALVLAAPLAVGCALFCRFYAPPWLGALVTRAVELLAGVPSVVFGLWGLMALVPLLAAWKPPGASLLAGMVVLALMIVPTIALLSLNALSRLPVDQLQGAAAVGLSPWGVIRSVAWPNARAGVGGAVVLGFGRAIGETMAVLMVCGNVAQTPDSLFAPVRTLTANIALEMGYALGTHRSALFVGGVLLLLAVTLLVSGVAILGRSSGPAVG